MSTLTEAAPTHQPAPRTTRRAVLQAGMLAPLLWLPLSVLAPAACSREDSPGAGGAQLPAAQHLVVFTPAHQQALAAVAPVILGTALGVPPPSQQERTATLGRIVAGADGYMARMSVPVQNEAREALDLLGISVVRVLLGGPWAGWDEASATQIAGLLDSLRTSRLALKRSLYQFLHDMSMVGWFGDPASWAHLGYPGPPTVARAQGEGPL